jgi:hypothetical protein
MPPGSDNATSIFTTAVVFEPSGSLNGTQALRGSPGPFRYNVTRTGYCASLLRTCNIVAALTLAQIALARCP